MADGFTPPGKQEQSAKVANEILAAYSTKTGQDDDQTALQDLLTDLMHHAAFYGDMDFDLALSNAENHFAAEV